MNKFTWPPWVQRSTVVLLIVSSAVLTTFTGSFASRPSNVAGLESSANSATSLVLSIFVYVDRVGRGGCDGFFERGLDRPLPDAGVTLTLPTSQILCEVSGPNGLTVTHIADLGPEDKITVEVSPPI